MHQKIRQWGNSYAIRIPKEIIEKTGLSLGATVLVSTRKKSISLKRVRRTESLADLIKKISDNNRHSEIEWGMPRGKEVW
jgi:antitoxin MazE